MNSLRQRSSVRNGVRAAAAAFGCTVALAGSPAYAQFGASCRVTGEERLAVLAVTWDAGTLTMAVAGTNGWRTRTIPIKAQHEITRVRMSASGTQMKLMFRDRPQEVAVDVSRLVVEIPDGRPPGHKLPDETFEEGTEASDAELNKLRPGSRWQTFRIVPAPELYAPVLQFVRGEPVRPSRFEIWDQLSAPGEGKTRERLLFQEYRRAHHANDPVVYGRVCSYAGSWLYQYWLYFPFDFGYGGHLHDSEHFFVEVDKLGGTIRQLAGAGHGLGAANGIYHTFNKDSLGLELPIFIFVELGKHATAPDVDGNGYFTPGLDINAHLHSAKTWGVRDTLATTDSQLREYDSSMTVPRRPENRLASRTFNSLFLATDAVPQPSDEKVEQPGALMRPELQAQPEGTGYLLEELPRDLHRSPCKGPFVPCAQAAVASHSDLEHPERILKAGFFPTAFMRFSYDLEPTLAGPGAEASTRQGHFFRVGFGFEVHKLLARVPVVKKLPPLPGRLVLEASAGTQQRRGLDDTVLVEREAALSSWSVRYELLLSNLYGVYYGWQTSFRADPRYEKEPGYGSRLGLGLLFQMPLPGERWSLHVQNGLAVDVLFGLANEFRLGLAVRVGDKKKFGIDSKAPNPYDIPVVQR